MVDTNGLLTEGQRFAVKDLIFHQLEVYDIKQAKLHEEHSEKHDEIVKKIDRLLYLVIVTLVTALVDLITHAHV